MVAIGSRVLGLACAFLNTALSSMGFVLQRKAHLMSERGIHSRHPLKPIGIVLYIVAALPDVVAYTLIPQVLCATVACFRVVVVCILGHVFLGEHLAQRDSRSIAICTFGTVLCVAFGPGSDENKALNNLHHPKVVAYSVVGLGVLVVFMVIVHADSFGWLVSSSKLYRYSLPVATALAYAVEKVYNTELGFVQKPEHILYEPMWLCMVIMVALLGLTDFYLNLRAASRMPVHQFVPLSFAFGTSLQCFQAMVIFDEFVGMSLVCSMMTLFGAGLSLAGALMMEPPQVEGRDKTKEIPLHSAAKVSSDRWDISECAAWCHQKAKTVYRHHLKKGRSQELQFKEV